MPVKADPIVPASPEPSSPPRRTAEIVRLALASASVSLSSMISLEPLLTVRVSPSFTVPVSLAATGSSLIPIIVIVIRPVSVVDPSLTV